MNPDELEADPVGGVRACLHRAEGRAAGAAGVPPQCTGAAGPQRGSRGGGAQGVRHCAEPPLVSGGANAVAAATKAIETVQKRTAQYLPTVRLEQLRELAARPLDGGHCRAVIA